MIFPGTILVVDDDARMRQALRQMLRPIHACGIFEAADGHEACASYRARRPDLVLLDLNMPGMDGMETLNRLKAFDPLSVVIICSSHPREDYLAEVLVAGAANYICKTTPPQDVTAIVRATIRACFAKPGTPATGSRPPGESFFPLPLRGRP